MYVCLFFAVVTVEFRPFEYTVSESDKDVGLILVADKEASFDYTVEVTTANTTAYGIFHSQIRMCAYIECYF